MVCVLICVFYMLYSNFGVIDYFPSLEVSRILTYPLLATGIGALALRPTNRFAQKGMAVAAILSLETIYTLLSYAGLLPDFLRGLHSSVPSGFYQTVKFLTLPLRISGTSFHYLESAAYFLLTCAVSCICAKAYVENRWLKLVCLFGVTFLLSFPVTLGIEIMTGSGLGHVWFMLMHTSLFWHLVVWKQATGDADMPSYIRAL